MHREHLRPLLLTTTSIAVGTAAWSGHVLALPFAVLFPLLWAMASTRMTAVLVAAGYFLAASRGLPQGVAAFYASDLWPGMLLWLCASSGFVAVHTVLWTRSELARPRRYFLAALLMAVPPFGISGWAHPITSAGVLFPGWGWWGLAATTISLAGLQTRAWPVAALALSGFWLWSAATWTEPGKPANWQGVSLTLGSSLGRDTSIRRHRDLVDSTRTRAVANASVIVLPESALGYWTPTVERLWVTALRGIDVTVIAGAVELDADGYDSVLVALSKNGANILYRERMPVPGSMWQPWWSLFGSSGGARAHFFDNPVVAVAGRQIAPLICYEQLIVWPILQSMFHDPDVILAVGNGWWTKDTSIVEIQLVSTQAWARLFDKPLVYSFNK